MENKPSSSPPPSSEQPSSEQPAAEAIHAGDTGYHAQTPPNVTWAVPPKIVVQPSRGRFGRAFSWLGWLGLLICIPALIGMQVAYQEYFDNSGGVYERFHSGNKTAKNKVAIIEMRGAIFDGDGFVKRQIERVADDENVKGIVLRINSPGGTVTGSDFIYHHLRQLVDDEDRDLPMVVSMGAMAASGGYYVAMAVGDQEGSIYAEPTTTTGSIGVIIPHYDLSGLLERMDVKNDSIVSNPRKQLLSMTRKISDEDRQILQRYVDQSFNRFKDIVRAGRPILRNDPDALDRLATGEIFTADQAKKDGLIDEIGFVEDAIERVIELTGLDKDSVRVVRYKRPSTLLEAVGMKAVAAVDPQMSMLEMTVPRAYYMLTTVPGLTPLGE